MTPCPSYETLVGFVDNVLDDTVRQRLSQHLRECEGCGEAVGICLQQSVSGSVGALGSTTSEEASEPGAQHSLEPGAKIARYSILHQVGQGTFGIVYAAYDPQLDRRVALKVLYRREEKGAAALREARAAAKLSHPNVVHVYDVLDLNGHAVVAMEYVDGIDLRTWLRLNSPGPAKIVDLFLHIGAGLQHAHEARLVHRDFKPENVIVTSEALAKVCDFGLAEFQGAGKEAAGSVVGTPAYMSPEQRSGQAVDARSDQYSFCLALCEALTGQRPIDSAIEAGVPKAIAPALARGLAADKSQRFPSMKALLDALDGAQTTRRWLRLSAVGALVLLAAGGVTLAAKASIHDEAAGPCDVLQKRYEELWNPAQAQNLEKNFEDSPLKKQAQFFAATASDRVTKLSALHLDACVATYGRGEQSELMFDRQSLCLLPQVKEISAAIETAATGEFALAQTALVHLEEPSSCGASKELLAMQAPPASADVRQEIDTIEAALAKQGDSHSSMEVVEVATALAKQAHSTGYWPLVVRAEINLVNHLERLGLPDDQAEALQRARDAASQAQNFSQQAIIHAKMAEVAVQRQRLDEAEILLSTAESLLKGTVLLAPKIKVQIAAVRAMIMIERKDVSEVLDYLHSLQPTIDAIRSERERFSMMALLASLEVKAYDLANRHHDALAAIERVFDLDKALYGETSPLIAKSLLNLAVQQRAVGKLTEAAEATQQAIKLQEGPGGSSRELARGLQLQAILLRTRGDLPEALQTLERAETVGVEAWGADHATVWGIRSSRAILLLDEGHFADAIDLFRTYVQWAEKHDELNDVRLVRGRFNLAHAIVSGGRDAELLEAEDLLTKLSESVGESSIVQVNIAVVKGSLAERQKRHLDAAQHFASAVTIAEALGTASPSLVGTAMTSRVDAEWNAGLHREAKRSARRAIRFVKEHEAEVSAELIDKLKTLEAWLVKADAE